MTQNILIVEDDDDIGELLTLNLEILGYEVTRCTDGESGLNKASSEDFQLVILDLMLPKLDGLKVCQRLRAQQNFTPILMLTAKNSETDRVLGLEVGADDYLTKPFSILELQARVKALLRRVDMMAPKPDNNDESNHCLSAKNLFIDVAKRHVTVNEKEVELTVREFDLLFYLASSPGRVYSREQLLNAVWGYNHTGYEHTVNSHINRLRAKIEKDPAHPDHVLTVWGVGYKFNDQ